MAIAPSTRIAVKLAARAPGTAPELVAFGNPDVGPEYALPGSEPEVKQLATLFPDATIYLHDQASEAHFRKLASQSGMLTVPPHAQSARVLPLSFHPLMPHTNTQTNRPP